MKSLLVLSFYLTALSFVSGMILNETSLLIRPKATNIQSPSQKAFLLRPRARERKIGKIIFLKNLLELNCLKKTMQNIHDKNQWDYQRCHKRPNVSLAQNLQNQNQILKAKKTRPNPSQIKPRHRANQLDSRIILSPNTGKFIGDYINRSLKNKTFPLTPTEVMSNLKFIPPLPFAFNRRKNDENAKFFTKVENNSKMVLSGGNKKTHHQPKQPNQNIKSKSTIDEIANYSLQNIKRMQPHQVKEPLGEENFNQKITGTLKNHQLGRENYLESSFLGRKLGRKAEKLKPPSTSLYIKNGKTNSLIKATTLAKPVNPSKILTKEIFSESPSRSSHIIFDPNKSVIVSNSDLAGLEKKMVENKSTANPQEQIRHLINSIPYSSINSTKTKTTVKPEIETNITTTHTVLNVENIFTTVTNAPTSMVTIKYLPEKETKNVGGKLEPTTIEPEFRTVAFPEFTHKKDLDEPNENQESNNISTSPPLTTNPNEIKKFITKENESFLFTSLKSQTTTMGLVSSKFSLSTSPKETTQSSDITEAVKIRTETNFPEEELTKLPFTEFTSRPLVTDLLPTNKKEQETVGKNSRKMHFSPEILTTTTAPDQVSQSENLEQRRSDILIDDLDDYLLQGSDSSLNYMKRLKQNNNLNPSSDYIIQLIPYVINDFRENKIPSQDIPILSKAFGDYWPIVLTLINSTNLDMLPLLKMKNEEDLNKILSTFFPEKSEKNLEIMAAEFQKSSRDKVQAYYYEDDYANLSKEQQEYWKDEDDYVDLSKEQQEYWKDEETFKLKRDVKKIYEIF